MPRSRLATKITLLIVAVMIVGFGASTVFSLRREEGLLVDQSKIAARRLTATLVASIEAAMLQERPDVTRSVLQELKSATPVEGLDVYRRNGVEAFTDLATLEEVKKNADLSPEVLANIQKMQRAPSSTATGPLFTRALETQKVQEALVTQNGVPLFPLLYPVPNQARCQGCHGADHTVRAVVRVATSMAPVLAEVRRQRNQQILIAVLTIAAAGAVLAFAMGHVVVRPIAALAAAARRVGSGDFGARAPVRSRDELGQLGVVFNEMTERLARAHTDLESKNAELGAALKSLQESRQRLELLEQIKGELSKFVPEAVKKLLEASPNATELTQRTVEVSVLFLDITGYTKLSEELEPKRLNQLVQTYFSSYLELIHDHHGDVSATAGDGLMVIFQSERSSADHALNGTRAAFAIRQRTAALNEEYGGVFPPISLHMGINTGDALVGATKMAGAGAQRWTFTATGSTTNVAARLGAFAGADEIVVGPVTAERIKGHFVLEALGEKSFKNVSQAIAVYRVIPPGVYEKII
jgi:class 3 adenylate cyclase/HAMP domain-containing protein